MNSNQDAYQELYETPNMGIILEPRSLQIEERPIRHQVSLVKVGTRIKMWTRGLQRCPSYRNQSPMKGIKSNVHQKERVSMFPKCHQ
jgi:hypothetical protein